jgi:hypothetical protein
MPRAVGSACEMNGRFRRWASRAVTINSPLFSRSSQGVM